MSSFRELPLSARLVILGYVALGAFGVLLRVPEMRTWSWEDVAATVFMALQLGTPDEIPPDDVASLHDRYLNVYGQ